MPVNALNFVLTKTVLDRAVEGTGTEPTEEQKKDITKASFVSALTPGNLGIFVPFIVRDAITGKKDGNGGGGGGGQGNGGGDGSVRRRLDGLEESVKANKQQLDGIRSDLQSLGAKVDKLLAGNQEAARGGGAATKSS